MKAYHLVSGMLALMLLLVPMAGRVFYASHVESRYVRALAPHIIEIKNQGSALQIAAFRQADLLPFYGTSELNEGSPYAAAQLFRTYPTGFTVSLVGRAGGQSLNILQSLAAIGPDLKGKKVAFSISPQWFIWGGTHEDIYAGNFSRLHAYALAFSSQLSFQVKQGAASRMLQFPDTLRSDPLLRFTLERLADGSFWSRVGYYAVLPLGKLQLSLIRAQDHWETLSFIQAKDPKNVFGKSLPKPLMSDMPKKDVALDWESLRVKARNEQFQHSQSNPFHFDDERWLDIKSRIPEKNSWTDAKFINIMSSTTEWTDLDLLLQVLREMGARPLFLSEPIPGGYYDYLGVSQQARQEGYYKRLEKMAQSYNMPLMDFTEYDEDPYFVVDFGGHIGRTGWVEYDRALDAFYHDNAN